VTGDAVRAHAGGLGATCSRAGGAVKRGRHACLPAWATGLCAGRAGHGGG
jgi:hypothetical protein